MPLTLPRLDDRTYNDILQETVARIPVHTPEWTNHNDSDPGITMLQVFAWLGEMLAYRMNRVPELNYLKFLQLLGIELPFSKSELASAERLQPVIELIAVDLDHGAVDGHRLARGVE